ncbi:MAG TPA: hypothetical protein VID77_00150 [Stellaceae bacterium]|jgi:hypothetical protein
MKSSAVRCAVLGAALALAGCDANQDLDLSKLLNFPQQTAATAAPAAPAPAADQAAAPRPPPTPPPPVPRLARFANMKPDEVEALVGNPDFRRVEPPGELWQYRTAECVVDFFFYGRGDARHVVHADARGRDPAHQNDARCGDGSAVLDARLRAG